MKSLSNEIAAFSVVSLLAASTAYAVAGGFPLRAKYPATKPISTAELAASLDSVLVVDVRSKLEYDVIHVNGALHIPVADSDFVARTNAILAREPGKTVVFYCNGISCAKSYKAATAMVEAGVLAVRVYDSGIHEWAKIHPSHTTLLGNSPADPAQMISDADFRRHLLPYGEFAKRAASKKAMVVDVREAFQVNTDRGLPQNQPLKVPAYRSIPSDTLTTVLSKPSFKRALAGKTLLLADAVGKQVRWLQYFLEQNGYRDYYFLEEGVLGASKVGGTGLWR